MAERVARALNLLGADGNLLGTADTDALLELIDDYLQSRLPHPLTQPFNHRLHNNIHSIIAVTKITIEDQAAAALSSDPSVDEQNEHEEEEEAPKPPEPTAAEIVRAGLAQGQLDKECLAIDQRELDELEEELIQKFVQDGCKCDFGSNKSPCCTNISLEHFRSVRCQMVELTHDESWTWLSWVK